MMTTCRSKSWRAAAARWCRAWLACVAALLPAASAWGQGQGGPLLANSDSIPKSEYYAAFSPYMNGNFIEALKAFQDAERSGVHGVNGRWLDSVPLHTMVGECHYQLGDHAKALASYRAAIREFLRYPDVLIQVDWSAFGGGRTAKYDAKITWGPAKRSGRIASYPQNQPLKLGALTPVGPKIVIDTRRITKVHVVEIMRTLAVATRRCGELLGPMARTDPLLRDLVVQLDKHSAPPGVPLPQALMYALRGIAHHAAGRPADARQFMKPGMLSGGEYEHPLTPLVLLEMGHMALSEGKYPEAGDAFERATYAAAEYAERSSAGWTGVADTLEEAFRYGLIAQRLANVRRPFSKADQAAAWASKRGMKFLTASLLLDLAESAAALRNSGPAAKRLADARPLITVRPGEMAKAKIGARFNRVEALVLYQQGKVDEGDAAFGRALDFQKHGSLWMFQIGLADKTYLEPPAGFSQRDMLALFEKVLREPGRLDWQVQPLEAFSVLSGPRHAPLEHWFEMVISSERGGGPRALEIADIARRHRFHSSLPDGGRLLSLRWLLEAPLEQLDDEAARERRDLLVLFPEYEKLSRAAAAVRTDLQRLPLAIDRAADAAAFDEQKKKLAELARISSQQEAVLRQIAVDRIYAPLVFPPSRKTKDVQEALPVGHGLLAFFVTTGPQAKTYAILLTKDKEKYPSWQVRAPLAVAKHAQQMLREMGHFGENRKVPLAELAKPDWKPHAQALFEQLFTNPSGNKEPLPALEELVIVPDGLLWYVPLEALQVPGAGGATEPLMRRTRVRYAPTMSLALPDRRGRKSDGNIVVAVGRQNNKLETERAKAAFEDIRRVIPTAVETPDVLPAASPVYSTLFDQLIVLDDLKITSPLGFEPLQADRSKQAGLHNWLSLPWGGPDQVILPGFHTAAENALGDKHANGHDVFLSVCGMMATGTRTMLISRWRTGGKTSFDLVREFAQELPHATAAKAWQRSVMLCTDSPLEVDREPRLTPSAKADVRTAEHPFFWSGYLLIDTGTAPPRGPAAAGGEE